jgi:hypothetical protein
MAEQLVAAKVGRDARVSTGVEPAGSVLERFSLTVAILKG